MKVVLFDIPKLRTNYFIIVIGICLFVITIYTLTVVSFTEFIYGYYILTCVFDFIGFVLIYYILEIHRYSKNVENRLNFIVPDSEIIKALNLSKGIVIKRELNRVAPCIEISDMRWNYTVSIANGNKYIFRCNVVRKKSNNIILLLCLEPYQKNNHILSKPTLKPLNRCKKIDKDVLKLILMVALGIFYVSLVFYVGYVKGINGLILSFAIILGIMGMVVIFTKTRLVNDKLLRYFDTAFEIPMTIVLPYVLSLFTACGIPAVLLVGSKSLIHLSITYANITFISLIIGSFTVIYANKLFARFILAFIYDCGESENEIYPMTFRERRMICLYRILIDKSLVNMLVLLTYVIFLLFDTMSYLQWHNHIFAADINDAVKNSFIVYIAYNGFLIARSNSCYSFKDIAKIVKHL